jgi:hypothetical protein
VTRAVAESARYLYVVSRGLDDAAVSDVAGLLGDSVEVVRHRDLDAVVSSVPLDEFGEDGLKQNLERLDWLETVARGHNDVVEAVALAGPAAPLRLATICVDDAAVRRRLDEWHDDLEQVLDRVEGRAEWSVKVIVPPAEALQSVAATSGGAAYLRQKKAESAARQQHHADAGLIGESVHQQLAANSVASRLLPPQDPQLTGYVGIMVLNGAYLVDVADGGAFAARIRELAAEHPDFRVEGEGPWPPYSFAVLESR